IKQIIHENNGEFFFKISRTRNYLDSPVSDLTRVISGLRLLVGVLMIISGTRGDPSFPETVKPQRAVPPKQTGKDKCCDQGRLQIRPGSPGIIGPLACESNAGARCSDRESGTIPVWSFGKYPLSPNRSAKTTLWLEVRLSASLC